MKKLFLSILFLSHAGLQIIAGTEQPNSFHYSRYSPMVDKFMYFLASSSSLEKFDHEVRGELPKHDVNKYTEFFQNAQREIGVRERDILPVNITPVEMLRCENEEGAAAYTTNNQITVVPENFDTYSYGAQRIAAFHEAFHHKHHDPIFRAWALQKMGVTVIGSTALTTSALWTLIYKKCASKLRFVGYVGAPVLAFLSNTMLIGAPVIDCIIPPHPENRNSHSKYEWYCEFRADRDAVEHARCYKCAEEYKVRAHDDWQYLNKNEIQSYIDQFKKENLLCTHHR